MDKVSIRGIKWELHGNDRVNVFWSHTITSVFDEDVCMWSAAFLEVNGVDKVEYRTGVRKHGLQSVFEESQFPFEDPAYNNGDIMEGLAWM